MAPLSFPLRGILFLLGVLIVPVHCFLLQHYCNQRKLACQVYKYFPLSLCLAGMKESDMWVCDRAWMWAHVCAALWSSVCMLTGIMSSCGFIYTCNNICAVIHPLIVFVWKPLIDSVTFFICEVMCLAGCWCVGMTFDLTHVNLVHMGYCCVHRYVDRWCLNQVTQYLFLLHSSSFLNVFYETKDIIIRFG